MRILPGLGAGAAVLFCRALSGLAAPAEVRATKPPPGPTPVRVTVDVAETPELKAWAARAKGLVQKWYPVLVDLLASDGFRPPREVKLVFRKDQQIIAFTARDTISVSARWLAKHPDDHGMVIHELTHVVQAYHGPGRRPGWLVEGIADYVRFFAYEPGTLGPLRPRRARYNAGYRETAAFLDFLTRKYDRQIVRKLNAALRDGTYDEALFRQWTKKSVQELGDEWKASLGKAGEGPGQGGKRPGARGPGGLRGGESRIPSALSVTRQTAQVTVAGTALP